MLQNDHLRGTEGVGRIKYRRRPRVTHYDERRWINLAEDRVPNRYITKASINLMFQNLGPSKLLQAVTSVSYIREVVGSNLGSNKDHSHIFVNFPQ